MKRDINYMKIYNMYLIDVYGILTYEYMRLYYIKRHLNDTEVDNLCIYIK